MVVDHQSWQWKEPGARPWRPIYGVSIEFKIQWNFSMLLLKTDLADHKNKFCTRHDSDVCKISLWSVEVWRIF